MAENPETDLEQFAAEHGIPALLDHLGLDCLANDVVALTAEASEWKRKFGRAQFQLNEVQGALRQVRVDLVICRGEMEVSTQEEFVDEAIARIDYALGQNKEEV